MEKELLKQCIFDAVSSKRILKTGFVGLPGGIYSSECDTVAAHSNAVSVLALKIAFDCQEDVKNGIGYQIDIQKVAVMAIFHDYGEIKSLDTGAQSKAIYPHEHCKLHYLEREGLKTSLEGLKISNTVLHEFDEYRKYSSPESIIVHIADNIEGFEKAVHSARGTKTILNNAYRILNENLGIYKRKEGNTGLICELLVENYLLPAIKIIADVYDVNDVSFSLAETFFEVDAK